MPDIEAVAERVDVLPTGPGPLDVWLVFTWMPEYGTWQCGLNFGSRESAENCARRYGPGTFHRIVHIVEPK